MVPPWASTISLGVPTSFAEIQRVSAIVEVVKTGMKVVPDVSLGSHFFNDLVELGTYFGYAPAELIARSPWFRQGEALFAGGFVPAPTLLKMAARVTPEGGTDVGVPLR